MFIQAYGGAVAIVLLSVVVGRAICALAGRERWWAAPAVGLSALIVVTGAAIKLPGRAVTAACVTGLVLGAAVVVLLRRGRPQVPWSDLLVGGLSLLGASLPFLANGRVGLPGVSLDNDTDLHLLWAEGLRSSSMQKLWPPPSGYPLGPHSLVATLGTVTGSPLDMAFTALLIAVVPITAMVAAGVLADEALWRRALTAVLCSLAYLAAAYYAEGAFKETIMAGVLLAFVLHGEQVVTRWNEAGTRSRLLLLVPAVLLVAGAVYTYSYVGLAWFAASVVLWVIAAAVSKPKAVLGWASRRGLLTAGKWLAAAAALALIVVLPVLGQLVSFFHAIGVSPSNTGAIPASALGNLVGPVSGYEMLGIWWSPDFRVPQANTFHAGELSAFALAVFIYALVRSARRRQLLMPAAACGCVLIWWRSGQTQSPYVTAKALVIAAPLIMALGLRALLASRDGQVSARATRLAIAAVFCAFAAYSSWEVLRNEPVQAPEAGRELAAFHRRIGPAAVLFLGDDDYASWQLRDSAVSALASNTPSQGGATARANKPYVLGDALDFDSVDPIDLNYFRYVVTSNSPYASEVPANFSLLASERLYDLWERTGYVVPRQVIEPSGAPGAILSCSSALGRKLRAARGEASIMATPVVVAGPGLPAGASRTVALPLPPGEWELSIQYVSDFTIHLTAQGRRWTMPAYLGRVGPFFRVGAVTGYGTASAVKLTITAERPSLLTGGKLFAALPMIAATRVPDARTLVPLRRACGRYVDWYRLS